MIIINELVTPLDKNKEIDILTFKRLIDFSIANYNDKIIIFSPMGEGPLLTINEKESIINSIPQEKIHYFIYYLQLTNLDYDKKEIDIINSSSITSIIIAPPKNIYYSQDGLFLYLQTVLKKIKSKDIFIINSPQFNNVCFQYRTLYKLITNNNYIKGIYENSKDYSLIELLKKDFPNLEIYVNETQIEKALLLNFNGIISCTSLIYGHDFKIIIEDYNAGFINKPLIDYMKFIYEILFFSNNSTLIKAYLKRIGYTSMEVRLPLMISKSDEENLDLLLS